MTRSSSSECLVLPSSAAEPALCTPYSSMRAMAACLTCGMRGEAQVVLGGEVDAREGLAGIGHGRAAGLGRRGRRFGIGPQIELPAQVLPLVERLDAGQQVGARHDAIVAQAALSEPGPALWQRLATCLALLENHRRAPDS